MMQTYLAAVINSALAANKHHCGLFNAAQSHKLVRVWRVDAVSHLTAANTGSATSILLGRTSSAGTGSTPVVIRKHNTKAENVPSQIAAAQGFSGNPALVANQELAELTVYTEETSGQTSKEPLFLAAPEVGIAPIDLQEGEGLSVYQSALASAGALSIFIYFTLEKPHGLRY